MTERATLELTGLVQGVGFRPFVHALATALDLRGFVQNRGARVLIDVEGEPPALAAFVRRLVDERPPAATIDRLYRRSLAPAHARRFVIADSDGASDTDGRVPPDAATCDACVDELFDARNRRYRHAFVACAACGPRYTMIERLPFDRGNTAMGAWPLCAECAVEYGDPADRRFHAQGICCPRCGPRLSAWDRRGPRGEDAAALRVAEQVLSAGGLVAVKGLGGFHLACDATNDDAVAALRRSKRRLGKPFAVMLPMTEGRALAAAQPPDVAAALLGRTRPIVILDREAVDAAGRWSLSPGVSPGVPGIGVFLPYSPVHHLLLADLGRPLVLTSGNRRDEPVACTEAQAASLLGELADLFLTHDRPIVGRCDDSVTRAASGRLLPIRIGRGDAPVALPLAEAAPQSVLALGGDLKNTVCLVVGARAYVSAHVGTLESLASQQAHGDAIERLSTLVSAAPRLVVHDLHPEFRSTRSADGFPGAERLAVQHHHAHVLSCVAEHGWTGPVIGVSFDGAGLGSDGAVWGGEFLIVENVRMSRAAHLAYVPLPGGDAAVREPWRMALAHLARAGGPAAAACAASIAATAPRAALVSRLIEQGTCSPPTSSVGRLFDAVAALLGLGRTVDFEGQAALALEAVATESGQCRYRFEIDRTADPWIVHPAPVVRGIAADRQRGAAVGAIAAAFHQAVAEVVVDVAAALARKTGVSTVALTGGVFQNARLATTAARGLAAAGLRVLEHRRVPCNDGGLALGQALYGLRVLRQREA